MVLDSQRWRCVEAIPSIAFSLDGPAQLARTRSSPPSSEWLAVAEGRVVAVDDCRVVLDHGATLVYALAPRVDLRPLVGTRVAITLSDEPAVTGPRAQLLTIAHPGGDVRLLARFGPAGLVHTLGGSHVRAALSQRPGGPMVIGTDRLQYVVRMGERVRFRVQTGEFVVRYLARTAYDYVAYVVAEDALWSRRR
jgi:hypothetical protein